MSSPQPSPAPRRSLRRAALLTARVGIAHAALLVLTFWLLSRAPGPAASDAELLGFYASDQRRLVVVAGLYVMPLAAIAFLWFAVALRMWIGFTASREEALLSNVQLVSSVVFIALFLAGAAAESVLAVTAQFSDAPLDTVMARQFPQYGATLLLVLAMRMASMFVFTTTTIAHRHGILPRWFVWAGYAVGLFLFLSASLNHILVLVFPAWVLVLSGILLVRARGLVPGGTAAAQ